ncbi:MAG: hypothetical protein OEZ58_18005 [Gammaproteobacteria bacterium]|nr:hypothetical protein [Gammaproteobacteria bacterium]MDH5730886.1 hypothetical protein [Gammaproteobacteria bacterium]
MDKDEQNLLRTQAVMMILRNWGLSSDQKLQILAMTDAIRSRHLTKYEHDTAFPDEPDIQERIDHILGIADALRTMYPTYPKMGDQWMHQNNRFFKTETPMECILNNDLAGLLRVRRHIDCAYDWSLDDKKNQSP